MDEWVVSISRSYPCNLAWRVRDMKHRDLTPAVFYVKAHKQSEPSVFFLS